MKTLEQIRARLKAQELNKPTYRDVVRDYIPSLLESHQFALTLTLKKSWVVKNGRMDVRVYLSDVSIDNVWRRFLRKLNQLVWKNEFKNKGIMLSAIGCIENGFGSKNHHIHGALGNFPKDFEFNRLPKLIAKASHECFEIDKQHKEKFSDSGWIDYITKEVNKNNSDKVMW